MRTKAPTPELRELWVVVERRMANAERPIRGHATRPAPDQTCAMLCPTLTGTLPAPASGANLLARYPATSPTPTRIAGTMRQCAASVADFEKNSSVRPTDRLRIVFKVSAETCRLWRTR